MYIFGAVLITAFLLYYKIGYSVKIKYRSKSYSSGRKNADLAAPASLLFLGAGVAQA